MGLLVGFGVSGALLAARWHAALTEGNFGDLRVYLRGAGLIAHRSTIYQDGSGLRFTYPPFAAISFVPLNTLGARGAEVAMTAGSMLCLLGFVSVFWKQFRMPLIWLPLAAGACFAFEPVFRSLRLGQVNIILAVLVSVDCLALPRHRRGYLVGVAAGLKVTPGIFLLYLALQRDWRAVARGVTALAGSLAVSACIAPADTWHYWTDSLYNTTNVGSLIYGDNQSLTGVLARALRTEHPSSAIVLPASIAMLALGAMACHRELRRGEDAAGLICLAIGGLLASPIAWSHHWVWLIPAAIMTAQRRMWWLFALICGCGVLSPNWWTPVGNLRELHDSMLQQVGAAAFPLIGVVILCASTFSTHRLDGLITSEDSSSRERVGSGTRRALGLPSDGDGVHVVGDDLTDPFVAAV